MKKNYLIRRYAGLKRYLMVHLLSGRLPLVTVNEYPKSGGTWLAQMLSSSLSLPFPRNEPPGINPSIMHGHYLKPWGMKNVIILWRDGRDVMTSWYYHCLFKNERSNAALVDIVRRDLNFADYDDIQSNLPAFIEYSFRTQKHPKFSWAEFVRQWHGRDSVIYTSYEILREDTVSELARIIGNIDCINVDIDMESVTMIVDEFSFERQSGRNSGQINNSSFMRKGVVGDWTNHFSLEARQVFDEFAGNELIMLGYEKDHSWVSL